MYESKLNNDVCEIVTETDISKLVRTISHGKSVSVFSIRDSLNTAIKVPAAPKPSRATDITMYAKWYHCTIESIRIRVSSKAISETERRAIAADNFTRYVLSLFNFPS